MNGVLLVNKPQKFTSFDVVAKLRGILKTKKIGHGGTLDPMATGVLPVFVGAATGACDLVPDTDKTYIAGLRLGVVTDTQDIWGKVTQTSAHKVTVNQFASVAGRFVGDIMQIPPMYSAVKVDGKRLYEHARRGEVVERPARAVTIHSLRIQCADEPGGEYTIEVSCSKGTYIRTLCADIGDMLGCGAAMTSLVRTCSMGFPLDRCLTLEQIGHRAQRGVIDEILIPTERLFLGLPALHLNDEQTRLFLNGVKLSVDLSDTGDVRIYGQEGGFIGLGYIEAKSGKLRVRKFFKS